MKPTLVIATDCFPPRWDGVARFLVNALPELKKHFSITIIAPAFAGSAPLLRGIRVIRLPLIPFQFGDIYFSWPAYFKVKNIVETAQIVFNQTIGPIGICAVLAAQRQGIPVVSYVHSIEWELVAKSITLFQGISGAGVRLLARRTYNKASLLLVPSQHVADLLDKNGIRTKKKIVPLGVDTKHFTPAKDKELAKKRIGLGADTPVVGFCGRLAREKDIPTLCKAFVRVQEKYAQAVLVLVGEGLSFEECSVQGIMRVGQVNDVRPYIHAMDIFVLPSLTETSSLVTMEAMACGLPVIVTPVGSLPEYVKEGVNGFFFDPGDIDSLAHKIGILLENNALREKTGLAARKTIMTTRNWSKTVRILSKELQQLFHDHK